MSKPSWLDAPVWANWLAQDGDGEWFWHEYEPEAVRIVFTLAGFWAASGSKFEWARTTPAYEPWDQTLEIRP